jgi:hypothetical protein
LVRTFSQLLQPFRVQLFLTFRPTNASHTKQIGAKTKIITTSKAAAPTNFIASQSSPAVQRMRFISSPPTKSPAQSKRPKPHTRQANADTGEAGHARWQLRPTKLLAARTIRHSAAHVSPPVFGPEMPAGFAPFR